MLAAVEQVAGGALADAHDAVFFAHAAQLEILKLLAGIGVSWRVLAPLLEKIRHPGPGALVAQRAEPVGMGRPRAGAGFAATDYPIEAGALYPQLLPVAIADTALCVRP